MKKEELKMKICYINPTFLIRRPIAELIGRLGGEHSVGIVVPKKVGCPVDTSWHSTAGLRKAKIHSFSAVNLPFGNFEWPIPVTPSLFVQLFRAFSRYDVVHVWTYFYCHVFWALIFKLFFPRTKLVMSSDTFPGYSFSSGWVIDTLFKVYSKVWGWFLFSVPDVVHLYGKSLVRFAKRVGVPSRKIVVLPTGIDLSKFSGKRKNLRFQMKVGKSDFLFVYCGLIVPRKGIDIMIKALAKVKDAKVKLLLVGEGPGKIEFKKLAYDLGVRDRVLFAGWRKDIPDVLYSSDAVILPSRGEGLPGIVMEGMAASKAVLASNIPCIPDLVEDGKTGFLCASENVAAFAGKMELLASGKNVVSMGKAGLRKIKGFEWSRLVPEYLKMYGKCVE